MLCKHCNTAVPNDAKFCSYCGCEVVKSSQSQAAGASNPSRFWIKLLIVCIVVVGSFSLFASMFTTDPAETIQSQVKALRNDHFTEAYYSYTSKTFQDTVSLENFRHFIAQSPLFTASGTIKILNQTIDANLSTVEAVFISSKGGELPVEYRLMKEGDKWKILSIKLKDQEPAKPSLTVSRDRSSRYEIAEATEVKTGSKDKELFDPKPLYTVIQKQVSDVRSGNIEKSYKENSSKDFIKATPIETYIKFVNSHPAFVDNRTIEFEKISVENNVVTLSGTLTSKGNHIYPFSYSLVYEDGGWKVLHIEVSAEKGAKENATAKSADSKGTLFEKFSIGTKVNGEGLITDPSQAFNQDAGQIHLNVFLKNAVKGTNVQVVFTHVESGSKAPVASAKVPEDGDMILSFAFTPPAKGWPKGHYTIDAKSSTNAQGSISFKVE